MVKTAKLERIQLITGVVRQVSSQALLEKALSEHVQLRLMGSELLRHIDVSTAERQQAL